MNEDTGSTIYQGQSGKGFSPELKLLLAAVGVNFDQQVSRWSEILRREEIDWDGLQSEARSLGIQPLLWRFLDRLDAELVPADALANLRQVLLENAIHNLKMTGELANILDAFSARGIRAIPYKGPALATLAYGDLALREFGDLDILVNREDLPRAGQMLAERGYEAEYALANLRDRSFLTISNALSFRCSQKRVLVELHWTLSPKLFPLKLDEERLFDNTLTVRPAGRAMETLAVEPLLVYLCSHGSRHCWSSLGWIADVAWLIDSERELDWDEVLRLAETTNSRRMLWLGLSLAHSLLEADLPDLILRRINDDAVTSRLAAQVCDWLFRPNAGGKGVFKRDLFYFGLQEKAAEKAAYLWRLFITPNIADWQFLPLPPALNFLYSALRPIRFLRDQFQSR